MGRGCACGCGCVCGCGAEAVQGAAQWHLYSGDENVFNIDLLPAIFAHNWISPDAYLVKNVA